MAPHLICHRCQHKSKTAGPTLCLFGGASVKVDDRVKSAYCPAGKFANALALADMEAAGLTPENVRQADGQTGCGCKE